MFKKIKLGTKIGVGFGCVGALALVLGLLGYRGAARGEQSTTQIGAVHLPGVDSLGQIKQGATNIKVAQRTLLVPDLDAQARQRQYDNVDRVRGEYEAAWKTYESLPKTDHQTALWTKLTTAWQAWRTENNKYFELCRALDKTGIHNPVQLCSDLARFRGDHYKLRTSVLEMLHSKKIFEGGEDHAQCGFGKWQATYHTDSAAVQKALNDAGAPHQRVHEACARVKQLVRDGKTDEASTLYFTEMAPAADEFLNHFQQIVKEADDARALAVQAREQSLGKCRDTEIAADEVVNEILTAGRSAATAEVDHSRTQAASIKTISLGAMIAGLTAAIVLAIFITRSITKPINRIIASLTEGATQVTEAASQVSSAAQSLAEGASEQASSLEETSSALEQMAAMSRTSAENSKKALEGAEQARMAADEGDQTMRQLNDAMTAINDSSSQVSKIIKVIEEIAFQTNLLALNAAVEAARAGEHGKGFAVVAEEVRNLAQRCATAAKDTTNLIEGSVQRAKQGADIASGVGKALSGIVGDATKVSELINGIARAADEQAQGVEQVNTAVSQMDKVTQQNAAGAEESASAAEQLAAQAVAVNSVVAELAALVGGHHGQNAVVDAVAAAGSRSEKSARKSGRSRGRTGPPAQGYSGTIPDGPHGGAARAEFAPTSTASDQDLSQF